MAPQEGPTVSPAGGAGSGPGGGGAGAHCQDGEPFRPALAGPAGDKLGGLLPPDGEELVLGPFQGKPACVRIGWGKGVCGRAAAEKKPQVVPDVHAFPGHIPCDGASRSELVIPFLAPGGEVAGVLDLDRPLPGRFTEEDLAGLLPIARLLEEACL